MFSALDSLVRIQLESAIWSTKTDVRHKYCNSTCIEQFMYYVRFEVFTAVTMKNGVFWDVTPANSQVLYTMIPPV
jgi:hypothetical protein